MIQQFQHLFKQSSHNQSIKFQDILKSIQDIILNSLENIFPPEYDFSNLAALYQNQQITSNQHLLTYHLVDYFVQMIENNFISIHSYSSLETQTQKLQSTIRSHIKLEQEVKLYLQHLESKIKKFENYINHNIKQAKDGRRNSFKEDIATQRQTHLMRERLSLIRRNDQLFRKLQEKEEEIRQMREMNSNQIEIKENFIEKDKYTISKSEKKVYSQRLPTQECYVNGNELHVQHPLLSRLKTPSVLAEKMVLQNLTNVKSTCNLWNNGN